MAGRVAQLSSLRLGWPLGQSGLSGNPPLERHQSRQEETQRDEDDSRMARAVETRQSRVLNGQNPSLHCVLVDAWRHINPAVSEHYKL